MSHFLGPDDDRQLHEVNVLGHTLHLTTAEEDFNPEKKTLFATHLWEGSKVLGKFLLENSERYVLGKSVIEFGAGSALPSMCAYLASARFVCGTDYPVSSLIDNIRDNFERNFGAAAVSKVLAAGFKWGDDSSALRQLLLQATNSRDALVDASSSLAIDHETVSESNLPLFDLAVAAECLWRHDSHSILLESMTALVRHGGYAILSFSHHVPGVEDKDLGFFELAKSSGWTIADRVIERGKHMWSDREVDIFIYVLQKE